MKFSIFHILALTAFIALQLVVTDSDVAILGSILFLAIGVLTALVLGIAAPRDSTAQIDFQTSAFRIACIVFLQLSLINLLALTGVQVMLPFIVNSSY